MQAIQGIIEQKRAEVSRLLAEIETLEKAQALLGSPAPKKRKGRPKGSKNKTVAERALALKASKKAAKKRTRRGRPRKSVEVSAGS